MKVFGFFIKVLTIVFLSVPSFADIKREELNTKITDLLRPNWPFYAFLAIPRISEMTPMVALETSVVEMEKKITSIECIELVYFQKRKAFEPKATLERESLHELLCRAMKRAIEKTESPNFLDSVFRDHKVGLKFNFSLGTVKLEEIPYPPLDPLSTLEDVFVGEEAMVFGGIELPKEEILEINETPL